MIYKKAQGWGIDLAVAMVLFMMSFSLVYLFSINYSKGGQEEFDIIKDEANLIMQEILSEGYPEKWTESNVVKIGILNNGKINNTKIEIFYNLSETNYEGTKNTFNTKYDYFFLLDENISLSYTEINGIGKEIDLENIDAENFVRIERYTIYKNKPMKAYLYLWSK